MDMYGKNKVTIIIPVYNEKKYIDKVIKRIKNIDKTIFHKKNLEENDFVFCPEVTTKISLLKTKKMIALFK